MSEHPSRMTWPREPTWRGSVAPDLFPAPEAAAMHGFPAAHCRVLAVDLDGKDGFVVLDTGPADYRYLYGGTVESVEGGWTGGIDGNGGTVGWTITDWERELGVVALWNDAPLGAEAVRVAWRTEGRDVPVRNGVYLVTWWRVPDPKDSCRASPHSAPAAGGYRRRIDETLCHPAPCDVAPTGR